MEQDEQGGGQVMQDGEQARLEASVSTEREVACWLGTTLSHQVDARQLNEQRGKQRKAKDRLG